MADELRVNGITDEEISAVLEELGRVEGELTPEQQEELREAVRDLSNANVSKEERENLIEESVNSVVEDIVQDANVSSEDVTLEELGEANDVGLFNTGRTVAFGAEDVAETENNISTDNEIQPVEEPVSVVEEVKLEPIPFDIETTVEENNDSFEATDIDEVRSGDVVILDPDIADLVEDYDPSDVYRIESIDEGMAKLSRNGKEVPELSYIPTIKLTKSDFISTVENDSQNVDDNVTVEVEENKEVVAVEKGSKPIRWARHFIDKVRQNTSVAGITQKLETSIGKGKEKSSEVENINTNGKMSSFKTSLLGKKTKIAKNASDNWNKITGWFKKDAKEEVKNDAVEKNDSVESEQSHNLDEATKNTISSEKPYDIFKNLPEDKKAAVLEDLVSLLLFQKEMLEEKEKIIQEQEAKLVQAEEALIDSNEVLKKANDMIEDLNKATKENSGENEIVENNEVIEESEVVENNEVIGDNEVVENNEVIEESEVVENNEVIGDNEVVENNEIIEDNEVDETKENISVDQNIENSISEPVVSNSRIDWDDPIVKQELEANKLHTSAKEKKYTKEEKKEALKSGKAKLKIKTTFTEEEKKADEERRKAEYDTYDRERQAEVEAFWQNQAAYVGSDEYVQLASERANEHLERQNKINAEIAALEEEKREALIKKNNLQAAFNRVKSNLNLGAYTDEQIMALDQIGKVDENNQGFHR